MNNELTYHQVDYHKYCESCKYYKLKENENGDTPEPCNSCLTEPVNLYSKKPVKYEKDEDTNTNERKNK